MEGCRCPMLGPKLSVDARTFCHEVLGWSEGVVYAPCRQTCLDLCGRDEVSLGPTEHLLRPTA